MELQLDTDVTVHVEVRGNGPALVLLPGVMMRVRFQTPSPLWLPTTGDMDSPRRSIPVTR